MDNTALQPTTTNILLDPTKLARSHRSNVGASMGDCTLASGRSTWSAGVRWGVNFLNAIKILANPFNAIKI